MRVNWFYGAAIILLAPQLQGQAIYNKYHKGLPDERIPRFSLKREEIPTLPSSLDESIHLQDFPILAITPKKEREHALNVFPKRPFLQYAPSGPVFAHSGGLNPCLVSAWAMNEGSGLTLHDTSVGGTNTATINTGATVTWQSNAGFPGTTPLWNASGYALASSTTLTNFDGTTPFSVLAWVNLTAGTEQAVIGTLNASIGTYRGWELNVADNAAHEDITAFLINNYPANAIAVSQPNPGLGTGLHFIGFTYDGSQHASGVILYVDGVAVSPIVTDDTLTSSIANGTPARIGARDNGTDELNGVGAFVEVLNCVVTPTQMATYNSSGPGIY